LECAGRAKRATALGFFGMIQSGVALFPPHSVEIARTLTRSLPLAVLTSSQIKLTTRSKIPKRLALTLLIPLPIISNFAPDSLASVTVPELTEILHA